MAPMNQESPPPQALPPLRPWYKRWRVWLTTSLVTATLLALLPLILMVTYGKSDHRQPADAIVVFGAAVWPGNRPSQALRDRVMTGVELYHLGLAKTLILSGGPSDTPDLLHETVVMRDLALEAGVPDSAIIMDALGVNTHLSVLSTQQICANRGFKTLLAVSHFYHLPRITLDYGRTDLTVFTVPAQESQVLLKLPYFMAREVAAWWFYLLRPVWS